MRCKGAVSTGAWASTNPGVRIPSKLMEKSEMDTKIFGVKHKVDGLQTDNIVTYCILFRFVSIQIFC